MNLFKRTYNLIEEKRNRALSGKSNCIPFNFPRFEQELPGFEQGRSFLFTANSKVGKTQITDFLSLYNTIEYVLNNPDKGIGLKIFYFSLEMPAEQKMLAFISHVLYRKEGIRVAPKDLRSIREGKILDDKIMKIILKYEDYFKKIEEILVIIDDVRHPFGIYNTVRTYFLENGEIIYKYIALGGKSEKLKVEDYYRPNKPDEYVFVIVDHIGLISPEKGETLHQSIGKLSATYLLNLRNRFKAIPVVVQQQSQSQESVENLKYNRLKPTLDGLGDNKLTQRDFDYIIGLFSPFRHEIPEYHKYNIKKFQDNIRFMEILGGREGGGNTTAALYFDGAVNYFEELPKFDDVYNLERYYNLLNQIRV